MPCNGGIYGNNVQYIPPPPPPPPREPIQRGGGRFNGGWGGDNPGVQGPGPVGPTGIGAGSFDEKIKAAITNIANSAWANSNDPVAKEVVAKLIAMQNNKNIIVKELGYEGSNEIGGLAGDGTIRIDDDQFDRFGTSRNGQDLNLEEILVHESLHEIQAAHGENVDHGAGIHDPYRVAAEYRSRANSVTDNDVFGIGTASENLHARADNPNSVQTGWNIGENGPSEDPDVAALLAFLDANGYILAPKPNNWG